MTEEAKKIAKSMHFEECEDCAFNPTRLGCRWRREGKFCDTNLHRYADLIESLSAELEQTENKLSELLYYVTGVRFSKTDYSTDDMRRFVEDYNQSVCSECEELEQVKRERDAAVEALRDLAFCGDCEHYAKSTQEEPCNTCMEAPYCSKPNWQWRGAKEE